MEFKKFIVCGLVTTLIMGALSGCGSKSSTQEETTTETVQVTGINQDEVTATIGEIEEREGRLDQDGQKPDDGNGDQQQGEKPDGTPPADMQDKEDSENSNQQSDDHSDDSRQSDDQKVDEQKPDGTPPADMQDGKEGFGGKGGFTASDDTITFTITDDTEITLEQGKDTKEAAKSDIKENAILEVTLDQDNRATKIVIKGDMAGNGSRDKLDDSNGGTDTATANTSS